MTRINTNVSSLNAQKTLARSNASLQESLTRLSTGLRINAGKDDPAGLIASEVLRSDIVSVERAITNSTRANQMIATADSALGQVSSLLNDIRGLVSEAANTGAMSAEQIAANQLQIDSSLEAIDRIAQTTQFQGQRLIDGNLDFLTTGVNSSELQDLQIDQANFGSLSQIDVNVEVVTQATQATLNYGFGAVAEDVVLEVGGKNGFEAFSFAAGSTIEDMAASINLVSDALGVTAEVEREAQTGAVTVSSFGTDNDITITATEAGHDAGDIRVKYVKGAAGIDANYGFAAVTPAGSSLDATYTEAVGNDPGKLEVTLETENWKRASYVFDDTGLGGEDDDNAFAIVANQAGNAYNNIAVVFEDTVAAGSETAVFDGSTLTINIDSGNSTALQVVTAINTIATSPTATPIFTATLLHEGDGAGAGAITDDNALDGVMAGGYDGGAVVSTANEVVAKINEKASDYVTAALSGTDNGYGTVSEFTEFGFYGSAEANNYLQFLGPDDTRNIRFVANEAGSGLEVDFTEDARVEGYSKAIVQLDDLNGLFEIEARNKGSEWDDIDIVLDNTGTDTQEYVTFDERQKTLTIVVDGGADATEVVDLINNAATPASSLFRARHVGTSTGDGAVNAITSGTVSTSGGIVSEGAVVVKLATDTNGLVTTTANDLIDYFDADHSADTTLEGNLAELGVSVANIGGSDGTGLLAVTESDITFGTSGTDLQDYQAIGTTYAVNGEDAQVTIEAIQPGAEYDGVSVVFEDTATFGAETFEYDANTKTLTIGIDSGASNIADMTDASGAWTLYTGAEKSLFTITKTNVGTDALTMYDSATLVDGVKDDGTTDGAALLGNEDSAAIGLNFNATEYGSDAFVSVKSLNGASFAVTDADGNTTDRDTGTDIDALINGIRALGKGSKATLNTSALDVSFTVSTTVADGSSTSFSITGGGAVFQLGPDVVSNQQARLGISSVNTAKLGGLSGRLYQLRSGNDASLENDTITAAAIVEETITSIVNLRGRLGAFQSTTLDTNIASLEDTLENLTEAESNIRDADFAAESAKLTRNQILVQSGTSVLGMANQNPQAVLSLLR